MFAKAEFTKPIPQKICRTKEYCGSPQSKSHEFHNIYKFYGTTPQLILTHVVENRFRFRKSTSTSDFTNRIPTFFVKFRLLNSAFANTLIKFTNCTIFSKFVERLHKFSPPTFFFDRPNILWKIDSTFTSPFPLRIPQIEFGVFLWNLDM